MARRRMIDPHFWESGDVKKLDFFTRLFLIGMFSVADDKGRGTGGTAYLRSVIFPHDEISSLKIKKALEKISEHISVQFYEVDGQEYYQFNNWKKWQRVDKPRESLLPPPPTESENDSRNDSEIESKNDSRLKEKKGKEVKEKRKEDKNKETPPQDEEVSRLVRLYAENNGETNCTPVVGYGIEQAVGLAGADIVEAAIKHCAMRGRKPWAYVDKVICSWHEKGYKTAADAEDGEKRRDEPIDGNEKWGITTTRL